MPAMRKPTTVTAMPSASCSSASSSGNRQPQHVRASSSPLSLGAPAPLFGPMSSGPAASAAGGPPWLRAPRPGRSLPMAAAGAAAAGAGRAGPARRVMEAEQIWKTFGATGRASEGHGEPAAEGESRGVANCQRTGQDAAPAHSGRVAGRLPNPALFGQAACARACVCMCAHVGDVRASARLCVVSVFPTSNPRIFSLLFLFSERCNAR